MTRRFKSLLELMKPIDALPTVEWCERNVFLSSRVPTSEPGQWRRGNVAGWCRPGGPLMALDDPRIETVAVQAGGQIGKTTTAYSWLAKQLRMDPSNILIVMNSKTDAAEKCDETWKPMWEDSPALQDMLPTNRRRDWTKTMQRINKHTITWVGANAPGRLAAKSVRRVLLDEEDKYPRQFGAAKRRKPDAGGENPEAGAAALAFQRVKTFRKKGTAKIIRMSTPTDEAGGIHQAYLDGDQRKLYVKCPHCRGEQIMVWQQFRIDMDLAKRDPGAAVSGAHYECTNCRGKWTDSDRWAAIDAGEWRATAVPRDPRSASFWFPSWCSKMITHAYLAAEWLKAQNSQSNLQGFINSECGEPFVHYDTAIKDTVFAELEGDYAPGELWGDKYEIPADAERLVIAGVDVQKGYLVAVFRQFVAGGDSGGLWHGTVATFEELDTLAGQFDARHIIVDMRYRTREVQEWCAEHPGYIGALGLSVGVGKSFSIAQENIDEGTRNVRMGRAMTVFRHNPDNTKDILASCIQRRDGARKWLVPKGTAFDAAYCKQMTAEREVNGRWINPQGKPNHYWDAEALCMLGAMAVGIFRSFDVEAEPTPEAGK